MAAPSTERLVRSDLDRPQVDAGHYNNHRYNSKGRLASYWHQIEEVLNLQARTVLEVGTGSGFTAQALRQEGVRVFTLDVDPALRPTLVASVRQLPLAEASVDVSLCCQVLEHLPFAEFAPALAELWRVAAKGVVMSLPDQERYLRVCLGTRKRITVADQIIDVPRRGRQRPAGMDPQHFWEVGCRDTPLSLVMDAIGRATGSSPRTYRVFEFPYHRFFILTKPH